ncbi:MAG: response regulator transcription factor, partial [Chloroflexota bacterium]|nr:response regulator transcription factor [Chloroflexota bacterium]
ALMRRANESLIPSQSTFVLGDLSIDFSTREVRVRDDVVHLTSTEFRLLAVLTQHAGTVLPHHFLLTHVWGAEYVRDVHYLKVFVRRLRQKLAVVPEQVPYIQTEWGVGYRFVPSQ